MLSLHTFASGSEGNCLLVSNEQTHLLVDVGISCKRISASLTQLGLTYRDISAVLITHAHSDHICGLATLVKHYSIPLYVTPAAARQICYRVAGVEPLLHPIQAGDVFRIGGVKISVFPTSHDAAGSVDYRFDSDGSIGVLTDTGYVTDEAAEVLSGVDLLVLESNHDIEWLQSGPYPYPLKQRILSDFGHLSNEAAAHFAYRMAQQGTTQIVLAHLSRENNTPARALETVQRSVAEFQTAVTVAPRSEVSCLYCTEVALCKK